MNGGERNKNKRGVLLKSLFYLTLCVYFGETEIRLSFPKPGEEKSIDFFAIFLSFLFFSYVLIESQFNPVLMFR